MFYNPSKNTRHSKAINDTAFVAYSLGNFSAYQKDIDRKASAVVYLDFSKETAGKAWISNYSYEPILRSGTEIFPARDNKEAVKHIEQYLGPLY